MDNHVESVESLCCKGLRSWRENALPEMAARARAGCKNETSRLNHRGVHAMIHDGVGAKGGSGMQEPGIPAETVTPRDAALKNPLALAYLGDTVWDLLTRERLLATAARVNALHRQAVAFVNAGAQAQAGKRGPHATIDAVFCSRDRRVCEFPLQDEGCGLSSG